VASSNGASQRATKRRWPLSEKRRIVELTQREGASLLAIAREHGAHPNSLRNWKALYRAGKLNAAPLRSPGARGSASPPGATFVPVRIAAGARTSRAESRSDTNARGSSVVQLVLSSGATMRIEANQLDTALLCALVAEMRR
jgi:transposase-like protein